MTKVLVEGFGWVYIVVVLDWYTKMIVGYYAGLRCTRSTGWRPWTWRSIASSPRGSGAKAWPDE